MSAFFISLLIEFSLIQPILPPNFELLDILWISAAFSKPLFSILLIIFQVLIHVGVNIRLLPTTGMTLPFLSYGGSSLLSCSILAGLILNFTKR